MKSNNAIHKYSPKNYGKYFSDDFKVLQSLFQSNKIRFTQPWALNDPLEFNPTIVFNNEPDQYNHYILNGVTFYSIDEWYKLNLVEAQINKYGILSLTKNIDSFDMWSRYSNGHKGFLIEFKENFNQHPCFKGNGDAIYPIKKVKYVDQITLNINDVTDSNGLIGRETVKNKLFYKKYSRWYYEKEYRLF